MVWTLTLSLSISAPPPQRAGMADVSWSTVSKGNHRGHIYTLPASRAGLVSFHSSAFSCSGPGVQQGNKSKPSGDPEWLSSFPRCQSKKQNLPMVKSTNEPQPARTLIPSSIITQESQLRVGFSAGDASAYLLSSKGPFRSQRRDHLRFFFTVK